jgi:hypothetical protein
LKRDVTKFGPTDVQQILAAAGIRDEWVIPTPTVLRQQPTLVGYYRLLLGVAQKPFYRGGTGMGRFRSMEMGGTLNQWQDDHLPELCLALASAITDLIRQISPAVTVRDVQELPLVALGAQFQGSTNVAIGTKANVEVFLAVAEVVESHIARRTEKEITVRNSAGRDVSLRLGSDPDIRVIEIVGDAKHTKVAIEIKGGADVANVHNRAGEAEKSHQKAKKQGYAHFWTVIHLKGVDVGRLGEESPTTTAWFDTAQILAREGPDWHLFSQRLAGEVGVPLDE